MIGALLKLTEHHSRAAERYGYYLALDVVGGRPPWDHDLRLFELHQGRYEEALAALCNPAPVIEVRP